jgi:arsenate reductase
MLTFICYPKCTTCQKAKALLDSYDVEYEVRDIKTENPTYDELEKWLALSELSVKKFFNTSGQLYKSLGLKDKLPSMSESECLKLLTTDGMLVKRPLLVDDDGVLVGFNHDEWDSVLTEMVSVPKSVTIDITGNDIHFPYQWGFRLGLDSSFVQITLVDDRIAVHSPTAVDVEYTKPCKIDDNSVIRSIGLFAVRIPKKFLEALGIREGDKADLTREDNCISIRKHPDEPIIPEPEPPEPIMSFCCVCGALRYTGQGIVKVLSKHICRECIEVVKAL